MKRSRDRQRNSRGSEEFIEKQFSPNLSYRLRFFSLDIFSTQFHNNYIMPNSCPITAFVTQ